MIGRVIVPGTSKKKLQESYNQGVTDADNRANTSSTNYKTGYNKGKSDVTLSASGRRVTASNGKTADVAYTGSNGVVTCTTSGGTGNQDFDITEGWATKVTVNRTAAYDAGVTAADARTNTSSANYKAGYSAGANSKKLTREVLKSGVNGNGTVSATGIPGYENLTDDNFVIKMNSASCSVNGYSNHSNLVTGGDTSISYASSTGVVTYKGPSNKSVKSGSTGATDTFRVSFDIICFYLA